MAEVSTLNSIPAGNISTVNSVPVSNIALINATAWPVGGFIYNNVIVNSCMFDSFSSTKMNYTPESAEFAYNDVIEYSAMFDAVSDTNLSKTFGTSETDQKLSLSLWFKRSNLGDEQRLFSAGADTSNITSLGFNSSDQLRFVNATGGDINIDYVSAQRVRDCSGWYHVFVRFDTTEVVQADKVKIYINGVQITDWSTDNPAESETSFIFHNVPHYVGQNVDGTKHANGYISDFYALNAVVAEVTDFGEFKNGIWVAKDYTGSYGTHGFKLDFSDDTHFGDDTSGNANDFTDNNMGADHQVIDTPENNHCIMDVNAGNVAVVTAEGGLKTQWAAFSWLTESATFLMKTGKWYWEVKWLDVPSTRSVMAGILDSGEWGGEPMVSLFFIGNVPQGFAIQLEDIVDNRYEGWYNNLDQTGDMGLGTPAQNDVMQIAFDADNNKIWFGVNGTWYNSGNPAAGTNPTFDNGDGIDANLYDYVPSVSMYAASVLSNFGQRTFANTPPTGFNALSTSNLDEPSVIEPDSEAVNAIIYTGTGAEHAITGVGFQPDFVWIKNRDQADSHCLYDSVRGATKTLHPDAEPNESTDLQHLKSFDEDGFTLGTANEVNTNAENFVALCLKKGAEYGFDIVSYPGTGDWQSINHGLGVVPEMFIVKERADDNSQWSVFHYAALNKTDPETDWGRLDAVNAWSDNVNVFHDTKPTTTQFTVGISGDLSGVGDTYIAYLFASIPGLSKVFAFEGNFSQSGPYIYCGFRPRWLFWKNADLGSSNWVLIDSTRSPYNANTIKNILPSSPNAEGDTLSIDLLSNGFKIRTTSTGTNENNNTIVGIAFAEQPFKYSNAR